PSPVQLRAAAGTAAAPLAQRSDARSSPRATATRCDGMLRALGRAHASGAASGRRAAPAAAPALVASTPQAVGSVRTFAVCATLHCTQFKEVSARARVLG